MIINYFKFYLVKHNMFPESPLSGISKTKEFYLWKLPESSVFDVVFVPI